MSKILFGKKSVLMFILEILEQSNNNSSLWFEQFFLTNLRVVESIKDAISRGVCVYILHDEFFPENIQNDLSSVGAILVSYKKENHLPYTMHSKVLSWKNKNESKSLFHTSTLKPQKYKTIDLGIILDSPLSDEIILETNFIINSINGFKLTKKENIPDKKYFVNDPISSNFSLKEKVFSLIHNAKNSITIYTKDFSDPIIAGRLVEKLQCGISIAVYAFKYDRTLVKWLIKNGGVFQPTDEYKYRLHLNYIIIDQFFSPMALVSSGHMSPRAMGTSYHDSFCSRECGVAIHCIKDIIAINEYIIKKLTK